MSDPDVIDVESTPTPDPAPQGGQTVAELVPAVRPASALVTPAADQGDIVQAFRQYQDLTTALLTPDDFQGIEGKQFKKKSAWRKLSTAFGVSFEILSWEHARDADGFIVRSEFRVRAVAPNGRFADGYGACGAWDRCTRKCGGRAKGCDGVNHYSKPEHDIPATAETRAKNRAAADLFGMGEVSAEEVDRSGTDVQLAGRPEIEAIRGAAKALKAAGGDPGAWPTVLGVQVLTRDDEGLWSNITIDAATALLARLEQALAAISPDGGPAPDTDQAGTAETSAAAPPSASPDPSPDTLSPGDGSGTTPSAPDPGPARAGDGAEGPAPDTGDERSEPVEGDPAPAAPGQPPPEAGPTLAKDDPEAPKKGEIARLATEMKEATWVGEIDGDSENLADCARHWLADVISAGRTRSTKQLTGAEIRLAIKAAKLLTRGQLGFAAWSPDGVLDDFPLFHLPPPGTEEPTLSARLADDETEQSSAGLKWLGEFAAATGAVQA